MKKHADRPYKIRKIDGAWRVLVRRDGYVSGEPRYATISSRLSSHASALRVVERRERGLNYKDPEESQRTAEAIWACYEDHVQRSWPDPMYLPLNTRST